MRASKDFSITTAGTVVFVTRSIKLISARPLHPYQPASGRCLLAGFVHLPAKITLANIKPIQFRPLPLRASPGFPVRPVVPATISRRYQRDLSVGGVSRPKHGL